MQRLGTYLALLALPISGIVLLACASTGTEERVREATAHYQLGISYLNDNNIQPAFVEFQKALEINPRDKEVLNAIGLIYFLKLEDYPRSIEYFQRALAADRNFSEASNNLGLALEKTGKIDEAIKAYRAALENPLYRNAQKAFHNLGRAQYRMKRYGDAVDSYKEAIRRSSDFHLSYYGLALCYNSLGRYADAAMSLQKALEFDPEYKGDREKARRDLQARRLIARGDEEKDIADLLEILNY